MSLRWFPALRTRLRAFFGRSRLERELDSELRFHLDRQIAEHVERGLPPDEARRRALAAFGGVDVIKEMSRDQWASRVLDQTVREARHAVRVLRGSPGFALGAVLSLGFGLGLTALMLSVANVYLWRPLPVPDARDLVTLAAQRPARQAATNLSFLNYRDIAERNAVLAGLAAYAPVAAGLRAGGAAERTWGQGVSANYFDVLGIRPARGVFFSAEGPAASRTDAIVISHRLWSGRLGSDPGVVGSALHLNGSPVVVAGVAPPGFRGTHAFLRAEFWLPLETAERAGLVRLADRRGNAFRTLGRLAPGVTLAQAQADVDAVTASLRQEHPAENRGLRTLVVPETDARPEVDAASLAPFIASLLVLLAGIVLVIAGANVTSLFLARATRLRREFALRLALGSTRGQLVGHQLVECLFIAGAAGVVGFLAADLGATALAGLEPPSDLPAFVDVRPDWTVLLAGLLIAAVTGLGIGSLPALLALRTNLSGSLKPTAGTGAAAGTRLRSVVVSGQIALLTVLLVATGLFVRSAAAARDVSLGFDPAKVLLLTIDPLDGRYNSARDGRFVTDLVERVRTLRGVRSASFAAHVPFGPSNDSYEVLPADWSMIDEPFRVSYNVIGRDYFTAMHIPVLSGRAFDDRDRPQSPRVVLVNETLARRLWPEEDAVGKQLTIPATGGAGGAVEVIGVVADARYASLRDAPRGYLYLPAAQHQRLPVTLHIRTDRSPTALAVPVRDVVRDIDPDLAVFDVTTLDDAVAAAVMAAAGGGALLAGAFGLVGFALAVLGLYGLMSYVAVLRRHEIGVRLALGATASDVVSLFMRQGLTLTIAGLATGLTLSVILGQAIGSLLIGIAPADPLVLVSVTATVLAVTATACFLPGRRMLTRNPLAALRHE